MHFHVHDCFEVCTDIKGYLKGSKFIQRTLGTNHKLETPKPTSQILRISMSSRGQRLRTFEESAWHMGPGQTNTLPRLNLISIHIPCVTFLYMSPPGLTAHHKRVPFMEKLFSGVDRFTTNYQFIPIQAHHFPTYVPTSTFGTPVPHTCCPGAISKHGSDLQGVAVPEWQLQPDRVNW